MLIRNKLFILLFLIACSPRPSVYVENLNISKGERIAILPFTNLTDSPGAGDKLSNLLLVEVLKSGKLKVVEPGVVEYFLSKERIRLLDRLSPENVKKIGTELHVRYVLVGTVLEYRLIRSGKYDVPYISLSIRMIDTGTGEIVFAASHALSGRDSETLFGIGRITSLEKLSKMVAKELASSLSKHVRVGS
jgi:TolB-like protein